MTLVQACVRRREKVYFWLAIGLVLAGFWLLIVSPRLEAAPGINQQLNFQGRLLNANGSVVADGHYNMQFRVYQSGDGVLGGGDEVLRWTETRIQTNRVVVRNGYFSVNLGSISAFGGSVDWHHSILWLSVNVGGTADTPTPVWDGEMTPFKRLTASPYALNSERLGGLQAAGFVQLGQGLQIDASNTNASIAINKTGGTANILTLQRSGVDVFTISNATLAAFNSTATTQTAFSLNSTTLTTGTLAGLSFSGAPTATGTNTGLNLAFTLGGTAAANTYTTNVLNLANVAGTCPASATCVVNGLVIGTGYSTGISVGSGGITILAGGLALNGGNLTSTGNLTIDSASTVIIPAADIFQTDDVTSAGALSLTSATTNAITLDSGTTGAVNIGTGNNAKTINIGTGTAGNTINIGTNNTTADTIVIGSALDTLRLASFSAVNTVLYISATNGTVAATAASTGAQCLQTAGAGMTPIWGSCGGGGGGGARLDQITSATAEAAAQNSSANTVQWNWNFSSAAVDSGLILSESVASALGAQDQQALLELITLAGSTASPLQVTAGGADVGDIWFDLTDTADLEIRNAGMSFAQFLDDGTITLGKASAAGTINIGTGTGVDTINIGTGNVVGDVITIGNTSAATSLTFNTGRSDYALTVTANSVTTGTAVQLNVTGLTTGNALEITGPAASTIMTVGRGIDGFNNAFVSIGTTQQRDHLHVQGRINTAYQMWWQDCMMPVGGVVTATGALGGFSRSGTTARLNQPSSIVNTSGVCVMGFTGTLAAGNTGYFGSAGALLTERSLHPVLEARVQATTDIDQRVIIGFTNAAATAAITADTNQGADQAFFRKAAAGTTWQAVTRAASGAETVTNLANGTGTFNLLRVELDNAAAAARFYINGSLVATHTTGVPAATTRLGYYIINNIAGTVNRAINIDFIRVWSDDPPLLPASSVAAESSMMPLAALTAEDSTQTHTFEAGDILRELTLNSVAAQSYDPSQRLDVSVLLASQGVVAPQLAADKALLNSLEAANAAHIQINSDVVINGRLKADKITANQIEGLEILTDKINRLTVSQNQSQSRLEAPGSNYNIDLNNLEIQSLNVALNLSVGGSLTLAGGLSVDGPARFNGETIFDRLVTFGGKSLFRGDAEFAGRAIFNNDSGGFALIRAGQTAIEVKFQKRFERLPIVTVDVKNGQFVEYVYKDLTEDGFTIVLKEPAAADVSFAWTALLVKDPRLVHYDENGLLRQQ